MGIGSTGLTRPSGAVAVRHRYYAIVKERYKRGPQGVWATKYPQFQTPVDQSATHRRTGFTNGCVLGIMPQARARTQR